MKYACSIALLVALPLAACSADAPAPTPLPTATPTATPTPATPTPTPIYWPSLKEFEGAFVSLYPPGAQLNVTGILIDEYEVFAAVYVASECLAGRELSHAGFRLFVTDVFIHASGREAALHAVATESISEIDRFARQESALALREGCMGPFLYPLETELTRARGLLRAGFVYVLPQRHPMRSKQTYFFERDFRRWINAARDDDRPLIPWMCDNVDQELC